jgi:DNA primase catalytic core
MSLHKLTAGDGYTYLTRQVAAHDATDHGYGSLGDYYSQKGEAPGRWLGAGLTGLGMAAGEEVTEAQMKALFGHGRHPNADIIERQVRAAGGTEAEALAAAALGNRFRIYEGGNAFRAACAERFGEWNAAAGLPRDWPVPAEERARIRTEIGREMFTAEFGRPPADDRELSGFLARASRPATTAVAGYDLTFSPVKSVSTLWAVAPRPIAEQVEAAHHAAVADTVAWLEREAAYTRTGHAGVRQVDVAGLAATAFTHRDSRAGDPDLHTHVAVSNKVQTPDGRWLALDGRVLYKANVSASEHYNTRIEAELQARLGVRFEERDGDIGKRPVREIAGVDPRLNAFWSTRRAVIEVRRAELAAAFQADHGRPPTAVEAIQLAQRANLETRQRKHEPRSLAEQRAVWREQALGVLGGTRQLTRMLGAALTRSGPQQELTDNWIQATAVEVVATVENSRATWQVWHLRAEAERRVRGAALNPALVDTAADRVVTEALSPARSLPLGTPDPVAEPSVLRRRDGTSMYTVAGAQSYTSRSIVAAERQLVAAAGRRDGRTVAPAAVDLALLESTANGVELNPGQAQMVRELATSGARLQLAIAPAGSGKTTALRVLARAWTDGGGTVVGLAPTAVAAAGLRAEIGTRTDTLAKLTWSLTRGVPPRWVRDIGPRTLVIVDEAGMAGTIELARAVDHILGRGGSVRLVGDDQQLTAIAAGGVLRDIADTAGAVTLSQLMRFTDPAEGAATLALRAGDPAAIAFYLDHGRVHVGDTGTVADQAFQAWAADRAAGVDAVMLAPTRDAVAALNARARADRLTHTEGPSGPEATLADGNTASAGDTVLTRENNRKLALSRTDWVKNGDRWTVQRVRRNGGLDVAHLSTGRRVTLPADYVAEHVQLGYAATVHGAQGITTAVCHTVATGLETLQLLYVALSRGRTANHMYVPVASDGDPHSVITPDTISPRTAGDLLTAVLGRDGTQRSATTLQRELSDPATTLRDAAARYRDALGVAAETLVGADCLDRIDQTADRLHPGLTDAPAYPTLRAHLALLTADGHDPAAVLTATAAQRELDTAADPAAVLDWRIDPTGRHGSGTGPLPWLPAVPARLTDHPQWGSYLQARAARVADLATEVDARARGYTPTTAPRWAARLLDPAHIQLRVDLAVWRAATGVADTDRRPTGPPQLAAAAVRHQRGLDTRVTAALGDPHQAAHHWAPTVDRIDPRISADPYWPELADRLAAADRAGLDVTGLLTAAAAERPLPDEQPAAALWWRLSRHLAPAATTATAGSGASTLRPAWTPALLDALPPDRAERVLADPAWPALVAAVNHGTRSGWPPDQLLRTAVDLTHPDRPAADGGVPDDELATALVWHVAMLTDPAPLDVDEPEADPSTVRPEDLHLVDFPADPACPTAFTGDLRPTEPDHEPDHDDPAPPDPDPWAFTRVRTADSGVPILADADYWASSPIPRARLLELNRQALDYYTGRYPHSWAPGHLHERLGTDLTDDARFTPGYAPAGWTHLTDHLHRRGATDEEILAAGLGTRARSGGLVDRFRDRLVFPIYRGDDLVGFIGRRNPAAGDQDNAGPKYLNTGQSDLFDKGAQLYGLTEGRAALDRGAAPVLVEGPIDAIAITLAAAGDAVGVAPLGTAFTDRQADELRVYIGTGKPGVVVATDPDPAGRNAARRAYWQLVARGDNPRHLPLPDGVDPAELLQRGGPDAVRAVLADAPTLARTLVDTVLAAHAAEDDTVENHVATLRACAEIIGALPPQHWAEHIDHVTAALDPVPGAVHLAVIDAGAAWTTDPHAAAHHHLARRSSQKQPGPDPARWHTLVHRIDPALVTSPDWPALVSALDRAAAAGYDVDAELPRLAAGPLPARNRATELRYRLIAAAELTGSTQTLPRRPAVEHPDRDPQEATSPLSPDHGRRGPHGPSL